MIERGRRTGGEEPGPHSMELEQGGFRDRCDPRKDILDAWRRWRLDRREQNGRRRQRLKLRAKVRIECVDRGVSRDVNATILLVNDLHRDIEIHRGDAGGDARPRFTDAHLADIEGLDFTEAVTRMQSALVQIQANLQTSSGLLNLSILNFLR